MHLMDRKSLDKISNSLSNSQYNSFYNLVRYRCQLAVQNNQLYREDKSKMIKKDQLIKSINHLLPVKQYSESISI